MANVSFPSSSLHHSGYLESHKKPADLIDTHQVTQLSQSIKQNEAEREMQL